MKTKLTFFSFFLLFNFHIQSSQFVEKNRPFSPFDEIDIEALSEKPKPFDEIKNQWRTWEECREPAQGTRRYQLLQQLALVDKEHRRKLKLALCRAICQRVEKFKDQIDLVRGFIDEKKTRVQANLSGSQRAVLQMKCHDSSPKKVQEGLDVCLDRKITSIYNSNNDLLDELDALVSFDESVGKRLKVLLDSDNSDRKKIKMLDKLNEEVAQRIKKERRRLI